MTGMDAYENGDYVTALKEWRPLAEQGNAEAQYGLGVIYNHARGVPQDFEQAHHWYSKAAEQGHTQAQYDLGVMYELGRGVQQNHEEAASWYRRGAEGGNASAQATLGLKYAEGQGVPQNDVRAHMWASIAAEHGNERAAKLRDRLAKKMTPAQVAEAQRLARAWKAKGK